MRPLTVDILLNNQPLSADRTYDIECQAIGSKPSAKITWWMNGVQLRSFREKVCVSQMLLKLSLIKLAWISRKVDVNDQIKDNDYMIWCISSGIIENFIHSANSLCWKRISSFFLFFFFFIHLQSYQSLIMILFMSSWKVGREITTYTNDYILFSSRFNCQTSCGHFIKWCCP